MKQSLETRGGLILVIILGKRYIVIVLTYCINSSYAVEYSNGKIDE